MVSKITKTVKGYIKADTLVAEDGLVYKIYYKAKYPKSGYYKIRQITAVMWYILKYV